MGAGQGSLKSDVPGEALAGRRLPRPTISGGRATHGLAPQLLLYAVTR